MIAAARMRHAAASIPEQDARILRSLASGGVTVAIVSDETAWGETWRMWRYAGHELASARHAFDRYAWPGQRLYQQREPGQWTEVT